MIELLLWGVLPELVAVTALVISLRFSFKVRHFLHYVASAVVIGAVLWASFILGRIFLLNAWPTFLPHIVIGVVLLVVLLQFVFLMRS